MYFSTGNSGIFYHPPTRGNVFSRVCPSFCSQGGGVGKQRGSMNKLINVYKDPKNHAARWVPGWLPLQGGVP